MGAQVFVPSVGDLAALAFERVRNDWSAEFAVGAVFGVGEDVEVAVEEDLFFEEGGEDVLVEGGAKGEVGAGEGGEFVFDGVSVGVPSGRVIVGEVEDGELVFVEGAEADGMILVVGFDVDDGAFIGGILDWFGVFMGGIGHDGRPGVGAYLGGD